MPAVDLSSFKQAQGTTSDGNKFGNLLDSIQGSMNGLDNSNVAAAAGIVATKLAAVPACRVYHSAVQSIPNAATTALNLDSERFDTDAMHDPVTNNTRITVKTAGKFNFGALVQFAANATGNRSVTIRRSDGSFVATDTRPAATGGIGSAISITGTFDCAVNDYFEVVAFQDSGGALNTATFCEFWATRVST